MAAHNHTLMWFTRTKQHYLKSATEFRITMGNAVLECSNCKVKQVCKMPSIPNAHVTRYNEKLHVNEFEEKQKERKIATTTNWQNHCTEFTYVKRIFVYLSLFVFQTNERTLANEWKIECEWARSSYYFRTVVKYTSRTTS